MGGHRLAALEDISVICLFFWCLPGENCYRCSIGRLYLGSAVRCRDLSIKERVMVSSDTMVSVGAKSSSRLSTVPGIQLIALLPDRNAPMVPLMRLLFGSCTSACPHQTATQTDSIRGGYLPRFHCISPPPPSLRSMQFLRDWWAIGDLPGYQDSVANQFEQGAMIAVLAARAALELRLPYDGHCNDPSVSGYAGTCLQALLARHRVGLPLNTTEVLYWPHDGPLRGFLTSNLNCQDTNFNPFSCWQKGDFAVHGKALGEFDVGFTPTHCPAQWAAYRHVELGMPPRRDALERGGVTDSNRPQPLWQPPPTACLTASGAASEAPPLLTHPPPPNHRFDTPMRTVPPSLRSAGSPSAPSRPCVRHEQQPLRAPPQVPRLRPPPLCPRRGRGVGYGNGTRGVPLPPKLVDGGHGCAHVGSAARCSGRGAGCWASTDNLVPAFVAKHHPTTGGSICDPASVADAPQGCAPLPHAVERRVIHPPPLCTHTHIPTNTHRHETACKTWCLCLIKGLCHPQHFLHSVLYACILVFKACVLVFIECLLGFVQCLLVFVGVYWCLLVFNGVYWCVLVFIGFYSCVLSLLLVCFGVYWCLMVFIGVFWCLLVFICVY